MTSGIHKITGVRLYFIPIQTRVPLKFGTETLTSVTCARVAMRVADESGHEAEGWGETPLSVQWAWPSAVPYGTRHEAMKLFCQQLASAWLGFDGKGHPLEVGYVHQEHVLARVLNDFNQQGGVDASEPMPRLAGLICTSPFDLALHDAFGHLIGQPVYETYGPPFLSSDLARFLEPAGDRTLSFREKYPAEYLLPRRAQRLRAWHLVGGLDPLEAADLTGNEPNDGHPVLLSDWIKRDGLKCLKIKLRGNDSDWDYDRLAKVGKLGASQGVEWLTADFNCTVQEPGYVNEILDRLRREHPLIWEQILYVEQPFPYELERARLDVRSVSARKPLFLDESAHDWRMVRLGRDLGWTGVALKTCKTQTGAILSACWAKAHGLSIMVQDLTNPMLAQIPHVLLAAQVGTMMGVETNAMQFYPEASAPEEKIHPGLYRRRQGEVDLSTLAGPGFGYRLEEMHRRLPDPVVILNV